ncbi:MAG: DUF3868 domain-containing protein [Mediterranea massiliensis]|nr:DUF3868 domain-containing protein [Mediterranea massiliensis]
MKLLRYISIVLAVMAVSANAQTLAGSDLLIGNQAIMIGENKQVVVTMDITLPADMKISTNDVLSMTPVLSEKEGTNVKTLPAVWVYGRTRQIVHSRERNLPEAPYVMVRRDKGEEQIIEYSTRIDYEKWMHGADLFLLSELYGCANCIDEEDKRYITSAYLERYNVQPQVAFISPEVEEIKHRTEQGRAYLDFPVNKTVIYPDYRRNPQELQAIKATVDVVKNDANTHITQIDIHGYASPEGSYANNTRLAKGRTEALKKYVMEEYGFGNEVFKLESTPEDWAGLRKYVAENNIEQKEEILEIIDATTDKDMDAKEMRIRKLNPKVYAELLRDIYPALRHSDYVVHYVVRGFDVEEAKRIIKDRPQQLSLQEMFLVAQTYENGSEDFNHVFDVAVRMFPADPTANLNAAAIELQQGSLQQAANFLKKANPELGATMNNMGVLKLLQGDVDAAEAYFKQAQAKGVAEATANLEEVAKKRKDIEVFGN